MIRVNKLNDLGNVDHGWLNARHHFSFGMYYNPERLGFGTLRVINDDRVTGHKGFAPHPHRDMEIITYVRSGAISHKDSMGNEGKTRAGDVQVMSAGSGIQHSEYNHEDVDTTLYQIWIEPNARGVKPRWDAREFPKQPVSDRLVLLVSGRTEDEAEGALYIHQDAAIYAGRVLAGTTVTQKIKYMGYLLVSEGTVKLGNATLHKGDGAEITHNNSIQIEALEDAELVVIDVPEN